MCMCASFSRCEVIGGGGLDWVGCGLKGGLHSDRPIPHLLFIITRRHMHQAVFLVGLKKELHDEVQYKVNKAIAKHKVRTHVCMYVYRCIPLTGGRVPPLLVIYGWMCVCRCMSWDRVVCVVLWTACVCKPMQLGSRHLCGVVLGTACDYRCTTQRLGLSSFLSHMYLWMYGCV